MWFKFPKGTKRINVQQQDFGVEAQDEKGGAYFRAPNHFAGLILALPGFAAAEPPAGAPPDLPKADPLRDGAIADLSKRLEAAQHELQGLRSSYNTLQASLTSAQNANKTLAEQAKKAQTELEALRSWAEDAGVELGAAPVAQKSKKG